MSDNTIQQDRELFSNRLNFLERLSHLNMQKMDDTYSVGLLQPLLQGYPFVPITGSSLRPFCLNHMLNDVMVNQRRNIIEFGSGISTIILGRLIKKNKLTATILSIEHNAEWAALMRKSLQAEGLDGIVNIVCAPLKPCNLALHGNDWYDLDVLEPMTNNKKFDMVIIDGPPAWEPSKSMARYPAFPYMREKLSDNYGVYLDDTNREGEETIIGMWEEKYGVEFTITGVTLGYSYGGHSFYTEPFAYYY